MCKIAHREAQTLSLPFPLMILPYNTIDLPHPKATAQHINSTEVHTKLVTRG